MNYQEMLEEASFLSEIKEVKVRKQELIAECQTKISGFQDEISKLKKEKEKLIKRELKPKKIAFLSKNNAKPTISEIEHKIKDCLFQIDSERHRIQVLSSVKVKDEVDLKKVLRQLNEIKDKNIQSVKNLETDLVAKREAYYKAMDQYNEKIQVINQFIQHSNLVINEANTEGLTYMNGAFWDSDKYRVDIEMLEVKPISPNKELIDNHRTNFIKREGTV